MKIDICSDLHLEFGNVDLKVFDNPENHQVLVLGGDITLANAFKTEETSPRSARIARDTRALFAHVNDRYDAVIYLMGNHEHYHGNFATSEKILREELTDAFNNVYFLEKEWVTIPDKEFGGIVTFVGGTLWTNFDSGNEHLMRRAEYMMNDYASRNSARDVVKEDGSVASGYLKANDTYEDHGKMFDTIAAVAGSIPDGRVVVCTHHAPTTKSLRPDEWPDAEIHNFYHSDLDRFIENNPSIKLWTHGHTHAQYEHIIGNAIVACNPRGYIGHQRIADHFALKTYEI
ncbi:Calcineurin-like phosphoesterase domain, ApaH type [uncultured Caudovirales phage]|uniref:Calcineurin-like phosphoesterase domain, ApaH type n=1 Tax=uncultured Caudovirales phage TaxID=2100421 RepID=A0A6J5LND8_9CAUD|nr:Calcineurin-like phosphoesterase domain, ApaH type [uncultured Caudovirales phage]